MSMHDQPLALQQTINDPSQRKLVHQLLSELLINVSGKVFKDKNLTIDGYRFINCRFENCNLTVSRGTFEFHNCVQVGGKRIYGDDAMKCINLYCLKYPNLQYSKAFAPQINADGSFTIAKDAS